MGKDQVTKGMSAKESSDQSNEPGTDTVHPQRFFLPSISGRKEGFKTTVDDGYLWRKYGEKAIKEKGGRTHPRSYYKCTYPGCKCRKTVELDVTGENREVTDYKGTHNHLPPGSEEKSERQAAVLQQGRVKAQAAAKNSSLPKELNHSGNDTLAGQRSERGTQSQWQGLDQFLKQAAAGQVPANFEQLQRQIAAMADPRSNRETVPNPLSPGPESDVQGSALAQQALLNYHQQLLAQQNLLMMGAQSPQLNIPAQLSPLPLRSPTFGPDYNLLSQTALASPHLNMFDTSSLLNSPMPGLQPPISPMVQIPSPLLTNRQSPSLLSPLGDSQGPLQSPNLLKYQALLQGMSTPSGIGGGFESKPNLPPTTSQGGAGENGDKVPGSFSKSPREKPSVDRGEDARYPAEDKLRESLAAASNSAALWQLAHGDALNRSEEKQASQEENLPKNKRRNEDEEILQDHEAPIKKQKTDRVEQLHQEQDDALQTWNKQKSSALAPLAADFQHANLGDTAQLAQLLSNAARLRRDEQAAQFQMLQQSQQGLASLQGLFNSARAAHSRNYSHMGSDNSQKLTLWERRRLERSMGSDSEQLQTLQLRALLSGASGLPPPLPSPLEALDGAPDIHAQLADLRRAVGSQGSLQP